MERAIQGAEFVNIDNLSDQNWKAAVKQIYNQEDVVNFQRSKAFRTIQSCLFKICELVSNQEVPNGVLDDTLVAFENGRAGDAQLSGPVMTVMPELRKEVAAVVALIKDLDLMIGSNPPLPGPRRYGNMACRSWHDQKARDIDHLYDTHLKSLYKSGNFEGFKLESKHYLLNAFGSRQRLDYGTGHELSFLTFINALIMCDILPESSLTGADLLIIFSKYYDLVKRLILTYTLEPAGSHGVWGLDDHFHLIYILGSSQFVDFKATQEHPNHKMVPSPSSILKNVTVEKYRTSNLYFNAISFIKRVKTGPFNEHSPILYDVSAVRTWRKVNQGMIKMWFVEVLSKFPVVQHFYFGNVLYPWTDLKGQVLPTSTEALSGRKEEGESEMDSNVPVTTAPWHNNRTSGRPRQDDQVVTKAPWAK